MSITVGAPTFEHHRQALGTGVAAPRISWKTQAPPGWTQAAYEVQVDRDGTVDAPPSVGSADSVLQPWPAAPLGSREKATVRVRATGADGTRSEWSEPGSVEAGLLEPSDWQAMAIGAGWEEDPASDERRPPLLRREFAVRGDVASARLYVTAHGLYEVEINGRRVGDDAMSPGWTTYNHRLRYYTYDVTGHLTPARTSSDPGSGTAGTAGGSAGTAASRTSTAPTCRCSPSLKSGTATARWRSSPPMAPGGRRQVPSSAAATTTASCTTRALELDGWSRAGFDDAGWHRVVAAHRNPATLVAPEGPPVRCTQELTPVAVLTTPSGRKVLDFGQNLVGRLRIRVSGEAGNSVLISTAEVLQDGEIYTRPLRSAKSTDEYIMAGPAGRGMGAAVHVPRVPLCGGQWLAGRPRCCRCPRRRRRPRLSHRP